MLEKCYAPISTSARGGSASEKVPGLRGVQFFGERFYCIFGRFGKMTHLVDLKKCRGSSPGCPGLCAAPAKWYTYYLNNCVTNMNRISLFTDFCLWHTWTDCWYLVGFLKTVQKQTIKKIFLTAINQKSSWLRDISNFPNWLLQKKLSLQAFHKFAVFL